MNPSFCGKYVKLINDKEKIKTVQRNHSLPERDLERFLGKIGPAVNERGNIVTVQYYDGKKTIHITIHRDLLEEAHYSSCLEPERKTEFGPAEPSKKIKSTNIYGNHYAGPKPKKDNSLSKVHKSLTHQELINDINNDSITDITRFFQNNSFIHEIDLKKAWHCAAFKGKVVHMITLRKYGTDTMSSDEDGDSALHLAIFGAQYDATCYLTKNFPELLKKVNGKSQTPLLLAATKNLTDILMELLNSSKIDINAQDNVQNTALHYILKHNNVKALKRMLSYADINANLLNCDGDSAFHFACSFKSTKSIRILIKYCEKRKNFSILDQLRKNNESGQQILLKMKNLDLAHSLIDTYHRKWSHDPQQQNGTILHFVVSQVIPQIIDSLITIDPDLINIINSSGKTALDLALEMYSSKKKNYIEGRQMALTLYKNGAKSDLIENKDILKGILKSI